MAVYNEFEVIPMPLYCHYSFCLYQKEGQCTYDTATINEYGACDDCIHVEIPKEVLDHYRQMMQERMDSYMK